MPNRYRNVMTDPCEHFEFTTQAQVDFALSQQWDGSFSPAQINECIRQRGTAVGLEGNPYCWKVQLLKAPSLWVKPSRSPDTWLKKPYTTNVTPAPLPG